VGKGVVVKEMNSRDGEGGGRREDGDAWLSFRTAKYHTGIVLVPFSSWVGPTCTSTSAPNSS